MKKVKQILLSTLIVASCLKISAQGGTGGNTSFALGFLGFNGIGPNIPLQVRNDFNNQIRFSTNTFNRMLMFNGGSTANDGRVAFGENLPGGFIPQARVHLHQSTGVVATKYTNNTTGVGAANGLDIGIGPAGNAFFINSTINSNFDWFTQGVGPGTLQNRMRLYSGGLGVNTGQLALSNNLPATFTPFNRLHLFENTATPSLNGLRFQSAFTGNFNNSGYEMGIDNSNGTVFHNQYQTQPYIWNAPDNLVVTVNSPISLQPGILKEWMRMANGTMAGAIGTAGWRPSDGYLGLNQTNPQANIDINTEAFPNGEEFIRAKPSDISSPNVQMGLMNATNADNRFQPMFYGNLNYNDQGLRPALTTLGSISAVNDINSINPITCFRVSRDWIINQNSANQQVGDPINNRPIFGWYNASLIKMYMNWQGRLRIEDGATPNNAGPGNRPNNRLEITANLIDPYYNVNGNPQGNPNFGGVTLGSASGLRFTFLTSNDVKPTPTIANGIKLDVALSVDKNGDVIAIDNVGTGNNGVSVTGGTLQLGVNCQSTNTLQIAQATLQNDRRVILGGKNLIFDETVGGLGKVGIGAMQTACAPGNLLEVRKGVTSNVSGLRLTDLVGATPLASNNQVLSINPAGDVVLTTGGAGTACWDLNGNGVGDPNEDINNDNLFNALDCTGPAGPQGPQGPAGGIVNAQNGLNLFNPTTVELGGTLIKSTTINQNSHVINFTGTLGQTLRLEDDGESIMEAWNGKEHRFITYPNSSGGASASNFVTNAGVATSADIYGVAGTINGSSTQRFFGFSSTPKNTLGENINYYAVTNDGTPTSINRGFYGEISGAGGNYGADCKAQSGAQFNSGGSFTGIGTGSSINFGVQGGASGGNISYGGSFFAGGATTNYGIYSTASSIAGSFAGYFNGDVIRTGNDNFTSDAILKQNIDTISNALALIKQLKPRKFNYKTNTYPQMNLPNGLQYGLIAQDVQTILPELVNQANHPQSTIGNTTFAPVTYSTVEYQQFIPLLIRSIQQLENKVHKLDSINNLQSAQIAALTGSVASCCSNTGVRSTGVAGNNISQLNIELSDANVIVLNQNVPNPFAEQTTITYNVPQQYKFAQMVFKTLEGKIIKTVDITTRGKGQLNVFANDLSHGLYMYSLIVDGNIIDTKKMVKQ